MKLTAFHWMCSCGCGCSWSLCQPTNNDECDRNNHSCTQVKGDVKLKEIQTTYFTRKRVYSAIFFANECCLMPSFPSKMPYITKKSRLSLMLALIYGSTAAQCLIHSKYKMCMYMSRFEFNSGRHAALHIFILFPLVRKLIKTKKRKFISCGN